MPESLSGIQVQAILKARLQNTIDGDNTASISLGDTLSLTFTNGTGSSQADRAWEDTGRTLASGASESVDMYDLASFDVGAGAGRTALGQSVTLAEIVAIYVRNRSTSAGNLRVGGSGLTTAWNSPFGGSDDDAFIQLPPGGFVLLACPNDPAWAVADTSNHLLRILANSGDCTYDIGFIGRSA